MSVSVRPAKQDELSLLIEIERSGEDLFADLGIVFPPGPMVVEECMERGHEVLVTGEPPMAFAATSELDGTTYLEQISVHRDATHKGIGSLLLNEVIRRSRLPVTLITFRDVAWNAPWYARHGFIEMPSTEWGPGLMAHWQAEIDTGLHALGPRVIMRRAPEQ